MRAGCGAYGNYCGLVLFFYFLVHMNSTSYVKHSHVCESVYVQQRLLFHLHCFFLKLLLGKLFLACM